MSWNSGLWITLSCETLVFLYFLTGSISAQMLHRHQLPDAWSEKKTKLIVSIDCSLSVSCCISPAHQSLTTARISQCQCARQAAALCNKYVLNNQCQTVLLTGSSPRPFHQSPDSVGLPGVSPQFVCTSSCRAAFLSFQGLARPAF